MNDMKTFDHLKLVQRDPEEVQRWVDHRRSLVVGLNPEAETQHEHDYSCCRIEGWTKTAMELEKLVGEALPCLLINMDETDDGGVTRLNERSNDA